MSSRSSSRNARLTFAGVTISIGLLHLGLFALLGRVQVPTQFTPLSRPVEVVLVRPSPIPPPPAPPPPRVPTPIAGGGAPSAPSIVRPARPRPDPSPPEIKAPPRPAAEQPLVIGVGALPSPAPGPGQGGQGAGEGGGTGAGVGRGAGDGRFRLLRGPTMGELRRLHPPTAFRQRIGGQATLSCRIRLDTRLEGCRVIEETPAGMGFGQAALAASIHFRFQPPTRDGAPVDGQEVPVVVLWP